MKTKKVFVNILIVTAFLMIAYTLAAYVYLQSEMTADMAELTTAAKTIGNLTIISLFIVGLYHLYLLANAMKILTGRIINSLLFVIIIMSTIMLFADLGLLSEIGKEYLLWDVSTDWILLYCLIGLHIAAMIWGLAVVKRTPSTNMKLLEAFSKSSESFFLSVHQISLISGILGICGIILAQAELLVDGRYSNVFMTLLAGLSLVPLVIIILYWILKMRRKTVKEWMDEKQISDTAFSGIVSFISAIVLYALVFVLDAFDIVTEPVSFWVLLVFFIQLIVFSTVILLRNRANSEH